MSLNFLEKGFHPIISERTEWHYVCRECESFHDANPDWNFGYCLRYPPTLKYTFNFEVFIIPVLQSHYVFPIVPRQGKACKEFK